MTRKGISIADVGPIYGEWKRLHCGPSRMVQLFRRPRWRAVLLAPWLWWSHFRVARRHATVCDAATLATAFVWAFMGTILRSGRPKK